MDVTVKIRYRGEQRTASIDVMGEARSPEMLCALLDDLKSAAKTAWDVDVNFEPAQSEDESDESDDELDEAA